MKNYGLDFDRKTVQIRNSSGTIITLQQEGQEKEQKAKLYQNITMSKHRINIALSVL